MCVESINSYLDIMNTGFVKNIIITGSSCGEKTFFMMFIVIYDHSKGLTVITFDMMYHRAIQLGGWHWHKLICIRVDCVSKMPVCRMA